MKMETFARTLAECKHIELEGTFTHFASAEDFTAQQTNDQEKLFLACLARLRALGVSPGIVHMANSGAICARPSTWADMVRPGAILYGYHQSFDPPQKKQEVMGQMTLQPVPFAAGAHYFIAECAGGRRRGLRVRDS